MENKNLLSSVALFSELYNTSDKDIFDIIGEFILGICVIESKYSFTSTELKLLMTSTYGFDIPEAVLKTVLNRRLNKKLAKIGPMYNFYSSLAYPEKSIKDKLKSINEEQQDLFKQLIKFVEEKKKCKLTIEQEKKLENNFYEFILDNGFSEEFSNYISVFFIKNEHNDRFKEILLNIKEGLILYEGIKYTPDLNELGNWKNNLTIYLGTEYLFNSQGLNGELFQEFFYDFFKLVQEINSKNKGKLKTIELKYFTETKNEIDKFFTTAELIKSGRVSLKINKPAMVDIVNNAKDVSDIALRKTIFFRDLKNIGIYEDDYSCSVEELEKYNLEDSAILKEIEKASKESNRNFNESDTLELINIFTKINCLRKGNSNMGFEKCKFIYISENSLARYLGHNNLLKIKEGDFTYCKEMDFLTTKFWFYLNKGFSLDKNKLPKTFDLINKAKIILSSHLQNSVIDKYDEFSEKIKNKQLNEDQIKLFNLELKSKIANPEKIVTDTIDSSLDFLEDDDYLNKAFEESLLKNLKIEEQQKMLDHFIEKDRLEKEQRDKELFKNKQNQWAIETYNEERKRQKNVVLYFFISLIPEFIIVLISIVLFRIESFQDFLKHFSKGYSFIFWILILFIVLTANYIKSNFINKDKVKDGWHIIKTPYTFIFKKDKSKLINFYKENYQG